MTVPTHITSPVTVRGQSHPSSDTLSSYLCARSYTQLIQGTLLNTVSNETHVLNTTTSNHYREVETKESRVLGQTDGRLRAAGWRLGKLKCRNITVLQDMPRTRRASWSTTPTRSHPAARDISRRQPVSSRNISFPLSIRFLFYLQTSLITEYGESAEDDAVTIY